MAERINDGTEALKSSKYTGYHAFYKNVAGMIVNNEDVVSTELGSISKVAATMWKKCSANVRQDWINEGQRMREDIDCGLVEHKCSKCLKVFKRAKDLAYHEKQCGRCDCTQCGKTFNNGEALRRHMRCHNPETNHCEVCKKTFSTKQGLKRHETTHNKLKQFSCEKCTSKFTLLGNLRKHNKKYHYCFT